MQPFFDPSTTASAAASSFSTCTPNDGSNRRYEYKVFLSFRGKDTRHNFVSHLYKELTQKGIHTFMDDRKLKRGDSLIPFLPKAISGSRVAVVVLSKHYASSTWCLKELVQIMECRNRNGQLVVPIFYKVDPSDVKNQRGSFGEDLKMHETKRKREKDYEAEMKNWRNALTQVATIAGWDSRDRDAASLIECVVRDISDKLACVTSFDACDDFVAIGSQIAEIDKLLEVERDVHMLGIWGMGGIGKTTLAKVFYDKMSSQYEACYFLKYVKDKFEKIGAIGLQKELLSKALLERNLDTWFLDEDSSMIKDRLCCKKVMIVLDDVDHIKQLEVLAKQHNWFGYGSTIIITTRDRRLLDEHGVDVTYEVKCLKNDDALKLFGRHAFKQNQIKKDFWALAIDFVNYAKGLPLALQVLGCFLHDRPIDFWKDELQNLKSTPNPRISDLLKISFVGLEDNEKNVFLDIACFHNWTCKDEVRHILKNCNLFPDRAFPILIEKSLLSIDIEWDKVCMHELLQDMGHDIVRRESDKLGERSRLWNYNDIHYVLTKKKGTEMIKGISLMLYEEDKMNLKEDAFVGMDRLRFLKVEQSSRSIMQLPHCGLQLYTNELAYLGWKGYNLKSLSLQFCPQNLIELDLSHSKVETLWEGVQEFVNLKFLNLEESEYLARIPNLSKAQNIVKINLKRCRGLIEVHSSVQYLDKLEDFDLLECINLEILPSRLDSNVLTRLDLAYCQKVKKCPEVSPCLGNPKSLKTLNLEKTAITELPQSIEELIFLKRLNLSYCLKLENLSTNFHGLSSLSIINMDYCKHLRSIPKLPPLVANLRATYCESLENFSDNFKGDMQRQLVCYFDFRGCFKLSEKARKNIFSFALSTFALSTFRKYPPQGVQFFLPGSEIPPWICNHAVGSLISVKAPFNYANIWKVLCCLVFKGDQDLSLLRLIYRCQFKGDNRNRGHIEDQSQDFFSPFIGSSDQTILCNLEKPAALDSFLGNELSFEFYLEYMFDPTRKIKVNKCGISFLVDEEYD